MARKALDPTARLWTVTIDGKDHTVPGSKLLDLLDREGVGTRKAWADATASGRAYARLSQDATSMIGTKLEKRKS